MRTIVAILCCAMLLLCPVVKVADASTGQYGGSLTFSVVGTPRTFNYFMAEDQTSLLILDYIFDSLVEYDYATGELVPALASRWEFSSDGTIWTFHLRRDVLWHDGTPFTADDVIFTLNLVFDETLPFIYREEFYVDGKPFRYEKVDDYTIRLILPRPFSPLLSALTLKIMPRHKLLEPWLKGEFSRTWDLDSPLSDVVGTGPFQLVQYQVGRQVILLRNPRYWKRDARGNALPYLTRVVIRTNQNLTRHYQDLADGRVDIFELKPGTDRALLHQVPEGYTLYDLGAGFSSNVLVFNQRTTVLPEEKYEVLTDRAFRQAVAYSINQDRIVHEVYGNRAVKQQAFVSPASRFFHESDVTVYDHDLGRARELLAAAGYFWDEAGRLHSPRGWPVELRLCSSADNPERVQIADLVVTDLLQLGVTVEHTPVNTNVFVRKITTGDWDCVLLGMKSGMDPHDGWDIWHSTGYFHLWLPMQDSPRTAWEAEVDRLFELGASTLDAAERAAIYGQAQRIIAEEVPMLFLPAPSRLFLVRNQVRNVGGVGPQGVFGELVNLWMENP